MPDKTISEEIWKDIKGYEGLYQVGSFGNVKSLRKGRLLKPHNRNGYLHAILCKNGTHKTQKIHRLVGKAFIPNPENKREINHKNSIRDDNKVQNLEWCTRKENVRHSWRVGTSTKHFGTKSNGSKLTEKQVLEIRTKHIPHKYCAWQLAEEYGISTVNVYSILWRKTWYHI